MNAPKLLHSFTNHENLQDFSRFLLTSMGPRSTLKMFQSGVGRVSVTSSSKRILGCLEIHNDPCVEAIVMSCKSFLERFGDHGLYLGKTHHVSDFHERKDS